MKVLNLYSGIGGNRKLWQDVEVTAVEINQEIAAIYQEHFPEDKMIIGDAHEYLLRHYKEYDFIWTSRPCHTHSRARFWTSKGGRYAPKYPDLRLYEEIIFLQHYCEGKWVSENVTPFYEPLIKPTIEIDRHLFWTNFSVRPVEIQRQDDQTWLVTGKSVMYGFDLSKYNLKHRKDQILRNLVNPEIGSYILEQALGIIREEKTQQLKLAI